MVFFLKSCLSLLSIVMIELQVRVLKLTKMHVYFNVPPCIICTPCIICSRRGTSGIFGLWAFRKYYFYVCQMFTIKSMLRQNKIGAFFAIFWCETFFWPICGLWPDTRLALLYSLIIYCISFVYSLLPRPLSKIRVARDRYPTKNFNNCLGPGLSSELWTAEIQWTT